MERRISMSVVLVTIWQLTLVSAWGETPPSPRAIRHSDVVFMYDDPAMYEAYGCTVLGWAGRADRQHIRLAHERGVRLFSTSVGFLTEFRNVIDFSDDFLDCAARNLAGEPFVVPWLWDHKYKDQPAWWWCTNSPRYREYLISRLEQRMAAEPDGLHIDDYRGSSGSVTWLSGCFCRHCMAAFRQYLADNVAADKLAELGITDLDRFDYRQFLLDRGVTPEQYQRRRASLPLAAEFYDFHVKANTAFVGQYHQRAMEIRGAPLTLCVNSGLTNPQALAIAPKLSYFCCEVSHNAASLAAAEHPIYIYKLADGLNRPVTSTASGQDWAYVSEHGKSCLVRSWTALSYALGHTLMAPHRQWCYTKEKGTHWYSGPAEQYAWLYRFVRQSAPLLDGYEAVAPVAVVYDNAARRQNRSDIEPICVALAKENIPFTVVVAGDDWLDYRITSEQLSRFQAIVTAGPSEMDEAQQRCLGEAREAGKLVEWPDRDALNRLVPRPVVIDGSDRVMAVPRFRPDDPESPCVVHLLNRDYDGPSDAMIVQRSFRLRLSTSLFGERKFSRATLHAPRCEPVALPVRTEDSYQAIEVPELDLWAILALDSKAVTKPPDGSESHPARALP